MKKKRSSVEPAGEPPALHPDVTKASGDSAHGAARKWAAHGQFFMGVSAAYDQIPCGVYRCEMTPNGPALSQQLVETDGLLELPDDPTAEIIDEFERFWTLGDAFRSRGFLCKRGYLLWGPPGSGKTSCLHVLCRRLVDNLNGVILLVDRPDNAGACLQMLRHIEPKRPLIAIMEDLDALVERYGENEYLSLLDGEAQVDNVVYLASTNYPERLDRRFVDRPSRFDTIKYIGMPNAAARRRYFEIKEPSLTGSELNEWVERSEGWSVAYLKEMIIAVKCFGQSLDDVVERLEEMQDRRPTSDRAPDKPSFGFSVEPRLGNGAYHSREGIFAA